MCVCVCVCPPWVPNFTVFQLDVGGGEDVLAMLVMQEEPSVLPGILLQNLHHISELETEVRVGLEGTERVDD